MIEAPQRSVFVWRLVGMTALTLVGIALVAMIWPVAPLDPDEPLFACVARQMLSSKDFITPQFKGKPFWDRPVLPYWLLAFSVHLFGDNDIAYRIPGLLLGSGTVLATGLIGARLFGPTIGALASFILTTMVGGSVLLLAIGHDSALVFFTTTGVATALAWQERWESGSAPHRPWVLVGLTGILIGFACLSKGVLGVLLPAVALVGIAVGMGRRVPFCPCLVVLLIALFIGGSWYLAMHIDNPGFLRYYFYERHVLGFFTSTQRHGGRSVWVYLPTVLLAASPWTVLILASARRPRAGIRRLVNSVGGSPALRGTALWLTFSLTGFLIAGSRNPTYLLPILPPLALQLGALIAPALVDGERRPVREIGRKIKHLPAATILAVASSAPIAILTISGRFPATPALTTLFITVSAISACVILRPSSTVNLWRTLLFQATATVGSVGLAFGFILPEVARERSAASVVAAIRGLSDEATPVLWFNHVPPSALYHGAGLNIRRVYIDALATPPESPAVLVSRVSRLDEVRATPFVAGATHFDLGGKYHLFLCGSWRTEELTRLAGKWREGYHSWSRR